MSLEIQYRMLSIRLQRTGRKGHAMFRLVVQDSRMTPTSGNVVANLGSYDPHGKTLTLDKEKASVYLKNGAQPSPRAALLLKQQGVKLPAWVSLNTKRTASVKNPEKLRKNQPKDSKEPETAAAAEDLATEAPAAEAASAEVTTETKTEASAEAVPAAEPEMAEAQPSTEKDA
jgi:ribosomal protein S16